MKFTAGKPAHQQSEWLDEWAASKAVGPLR